MAKFWKVKKPQMCRAAHLGFLGLKNKLGVIFIGYGMEYLDVMSTYLSTVGHDNLAGNRPNYRPRLNI